MEKPTAFQRAVISALMLIADDKHRTPQEEAAAYRAVTPFLDDTPDEEPA